MIQWRNRSAKLQGEAMLVDLSTDAARNVLIYCRGAFHLPLLEPLARTNPDVSFYVHTPMLLKSDFLGSPLGQLPNTYFVWNFDDLKYKLDNFGIFITTDAQSANAHAQSLRIVRLMKRLGVPVFEMQHGLFQLGLHYYDVPGRTTFCGDSLPSRSYADRVLAYYPLPDSKTPITVIGYPPFDGTVANPVGGDYLLVLSNLHWPTYTTDERRRFYRAVYAAVDKRPGLPVIWKQHHGEYKNADCKAWIAECAKEFPDAAKRIRFHHLDNALKNKTLAELIAGARQIVSSISTVLLDCEMSGKPVGVYDVPSTKCLADRLAEKSSFSSADELDQLLFAGTRPLKSGLLQPFAPDVFRDVLSESYRTTPLSRTAFLDALFDLGQPLTSELRGNISSVQKDVLSNKTKLDAVMSALGGQGAKLDVVASALDGQVSQLTQVASQIQTIAADLKLRTDELIALRQTLYSRETELASVKKKLETCTLESRTRQSQLEAARKNIDNVSRQFKVEQWRRQETASLLEVERNRRLGRRLHRLIVALFPYGVVCAWKRMAHGCGDEKPLFYYPGVGKRLRRMLKFSLPYGLIQAYRRRTQRQKRK